MKQFTGENAVIIDKVSKSFNGSMAVNSVSFDVKQGEIFGLIGPNGAGKTTTIRMIMDVIKPDSGNIYILGERLNEYIKNKIGYLPEERGLYRKLTVIDSIIYLGKLKAVDIHIIKNRSEILLDRLGMAPHKRKKIEELSKGMGQSIQFLVAIAHDPQLVILDEPFAGLDPVNTEIIKEIILELKDQGKAIILSTHRMNEIEELCDRIFMINNGQSVLYGELSDIKSRYKNNSIFLRIQGELPKLQGISSINEYKDHVELFCDANSSPYEIVSQLIGFGIKIDKFEVSTPSLHDIFIQVVGGHE